MSSGINLLVEKKKKTVHPIVTKLIALRFFAVGMLFFVSVLSVILFLLISLSPLPQLKRQEQAVKDNLSAFHTQIAKLLVINERSDTISSIMSKRTAFDKTIDFIKSKLPAGVHLDSLTMGREAVSVTVSSKSLHALDTFINTLVDSAEKKEKFTKVTLTSLSALETKNDYTLTLNLIAL